MVGEHGADATSPWLSTTSEQPLDGIRVLDFSVMGPGPFGSMLLAGWGADVITVARPGAPPLPIPGAPYDVGKRRIAVDLKHEAGVDVVRRLAADADVVLESFRPGVMEKLGLGPDELMAGNGRLLYVRVTGYGQTGPYAHRAGHDINYLAVSGALSVLGVQEPAPPLQLLGDLAGGGLGALLGVLLGLRHRERTGAGTVIDTAIVDGVAQLFHSTAGRADPSAGVRMLNGSAPHYTTYVCADGRRMSVGALEPHFFAAFLQAMGMPEQSWLAARTDVTAWPALRAELARRFATKPRDEWEARLAGSDTCTAPVLEVGELDENEHLRAREVFVYEDSGLRTARAPRLRDATAAPWLDVLPAATTQVLRGLGLSSDKIEDLRRLGVVADPS